MGWLTRAEQLSGAINAACGALRQIAQAMHPAMDLTPAKVVIFHTVAT
jgi:hypothetical protein